MKQPVSSTKRVKAGTSQVAAAARKDAFIQAYVANGHNATQAAIMAGYSAKTAYSQGQRLLKHVEVSGCLAAAAMAVAKITSLTAERTIREVARISTSDPARLYREDGSLKKITEMDDDTRAAIASIEVTETGTKIKFWDKNSALEKAMKHLGLFEQDNSQQQENLVLTVVMAQPVSR